MRPHKHVTHSKPPAQDVFDLSLARQLSKDGVIPLLVTSEKDCITLFAWNDSDNSWKDYPILHGPIVVKRGVPSISNTWNWSRHVGLTATADNIYAVYKRQPTDQDTAQLTVDTFAKDSSGLTRISTLPVIMPTYSAPGHSIHFLNINEIPGFELWAGIDEKQQKLLIVTQTLGLNATDQGDGASLTLIIGDLSRLDQKDGWSSKHLDEGGYGLDVRQQDETLILAYRTKPAAFSCPLPVGIDPFFGGAPHLDVDATVDSDQFFTPVRLMTVSLSNFETEQLDLPGGEHPRIQNLEPLIVTVDRPQLTVRFRATAPDDTGATSRIDWQLGRMDKLTFVVDEQQRIARGILLSVPQDEDLTFPRTLAPWIEVQDLFTLSFPAGTTWASTWPRFPLEPLNVSRTSKGLFFDFLHKTPLFALQHSRAHLATDFAQGVFSVSELKSEVYDINHEQIQKPDAVRPNTKGENQQFAPFDPLGQQTNTPIQAPTYSPDNTIGGSLITDRDGQPFQFSAYTNLGDGGARVLFDAKLGPPAEPQPPDNPKQLDPGSVPGPGSGDEKWFELEASAWKDAGVPPILLEHLLDQPTLTSANHCRIESLLSAGNQFAGLSLDDSGWSEDQVNSIQTALNDFFLSLGAATQPDIHYSTDGTTPRAFISALPATVVAEAKTTWEAGIENEAVAAVVWTFTQQLPPPPIPPVPNTPAPSGPAPIVVQGTGNPVKLALLASGPWTVQADIVRNDGSTRSFSTTFNVEESMFRQVSSIHRQLAGEKSTPVGTFQVGTATFKFLQYEITFPVDADQDHSHRIIIKSNDKTDAQWRFLANGTKQGLIAYRLRIKFETDDLRLGGLIASLCKVEEIKAAFFYGRTFTPAILMNDSRSVAPLTGDLAENDLLKHGNSPRLASTLTTRPDGDAAIIAKKKWIHVKVSMLPQAAGAAVVTLLIGLGAIAAAGALAMLLAALGVAIAAAGLAVAGPAVLAVVAAAAAVFLFINFAVPPIIESFIADKVLDNIRSDDSVQGLEDSRFLQFAGEGIGESIARQIIKQANDAGASFEAPPEVTEPELIGNDRNRQNLFQMIHVSEGKCRVLVRL